MGPLVDVLTRVDLDRKKAVAAVVAAGALAGAGFAQAMTTVAPVDSIVPVAATKDLAAAMTGQQQQPEGIQTIHSVDTGGENLLRFARPRAKGQTVEDMLCLLSLVELPGAGAPCRGPGKCSARALE